MQSLKGCTVDCGRCHPRIVEGIEAKQPTLTFFQQLEDTALKLLNFDLLEVLWVEFAIWMLLASFLRFVLLLDCLPAT